MIRSFIRPLAAALVLSAAAMPAFAEEETVSQEDQAIIAAMLTEMGYEIRKIEIDNGKLEAYAVKDGQNVEIVLRKTFEIVEIDG